MINTSILVSVRYVIAIRIQLHSYNLLRPMIMPVAYSLLTLLPFSIHSLPIPFFDSVHSYCFCVHFSSLIFHFKKKRAKSFSQLTQQKNKKEFFIIQNTILHKIANQETNQRNVRQAWPFVHTH